MKQASHVDRTPFQSVAVMWALGLLGAVCLAVALLSSMPLVLRLTFMVAGIASLVLCPNARPPEPIPPGAPKILILRLFSQHSVWVGHETRLETIIVESLGDHGYCIMVGRPGERLPDVGARKVYIGNDWFPRVRCMAREAHLIVVVLGNEQEVGRGGGLQQELCMLEACDLLHKCLFVVPPTSTQPTRWRPTRLYSMDVRADEGAIVATIEGDRLEWGCVDGVGVADYRRALEETHRRIANRLSRRSELDCDCGEDCQQTKDQEAE